MEEVELNWDALLAASAEKRDKLKVANSTPPLTNKQN